MERLLKEYEFLPTENTNEYKKDNWILRLEGDNIEIFEEEWIENRPGKYYFGSVIDIDLILKEL